MWWERTWKLQTRGLSLPRWQYACVSMAPVMLHWHSEPNDCYCSSSFQILDKSPQWIILIQNHTEKGILESIVLTWSSWRNIKPQESWYFMFEIYKLRKVAEENLGTVSLSAMGFRQWVGAWKISQVLRPNSHVSIYSDSVRICGHALFYCLQKTNDFSVLYQSVKFFPQQIKIVHY